MAKTRLTHTTSTYSEKWLLPVSGGCSPDKTYRSIHCGGKQSHGTAKTFYSREIAV